MPGRWIRQLPSSVARSPPAVSTAASSCCRWRAISTASIVPARDELRCFWGAPSRPMPRAAHIALNFPGSPRRRNSHFGIRCRRAIGLRGSPDSGASLGIDRRRAILLFRRPDLLLERVEAVLDGPGDRAGCQPGCTRCSGEIGFWATAGRTSKSSLGRQLSWVFATSQAAAVLVPAVWFIAKWVAILATVILAVVALIFLFLERDHGDHPAPPAPQ